MADPILNDIRDLIEKNLPAQVGTALQQRLSQAVTDASALALAKIELAQVKERNTAQGREIDALNKKLEQHAALDTRETEVAKRERNAEILELKIRLDAETRFGMRVTEAMLGLVRNVEFRQNWNGQQGFAAPASDTYGMRTAVVPVNGGTSQSAA